MKEPWNFSAVKWKNLFNLENSFEWNEKSCLNRQLLQRAPSDFKLVLLEKELAPVPSAKDLGLFVDSTLSFDKHITIITVLE